MIAKAFWDSSSLVPLCVQQEASSLAGSFLQQYQIVVWWTAPVEMRSAFARDLRHGVITVQEHRQAILRLETLKKDWQEILPDNSVRDEAESLPDRFSLRAADVLQLAAAIVWAQGYPTRVTFISGDKRLLDAAHSLGFQVIAT